MSTPCSPLLLRMYATLLECDKAILRSSQRLALFEAVCRILVERAGLQLAWIGMLDAGDTRLWPQAHWGEGASRLDGMQQQGGAQAAPEQAMVGAAMQSKSAVWVDRPGQPGWQSGAALVLHLGPARCGVLALFDQGAQTFDAATQTLLLGLADNISTAITHLAQQEQRHQEAYALLESEGRYNALFASTPLPMLVIDPADGRVVDANTRAMDFYGYDHASITSKHIEDFNTLSPQQIRAEMARAAASHSSHLDFQHRLASGELREVEVFSSPLGFAGQTYLVSAIHDVTERRLLEARVQQGQSLMQRFIDQLPGTAFVKDRELRLVMVNRQLGAVLGVPPQSLIGKTAHQIFPPEFADFVTLLDREVMEAGGHRVYEEAFQDRHNETSMFVIDDGAGERFLAGLSLDITDRYHAQERATALLRINDWAGKLPEQEFLAGGLELARTLSDSATGFLYLFHPQQQQLELLGTAPGAAVAGSTATGAPCPLDAAGPWADSVRRRAPAIFNAMASSQEQGGLPVRPQSLQRLIAVPVVDDGQVRMVLVVANKASDYLQFDVETLMLLGNDMWRSLRRSRLEASLKNRVDALEQANQRLADMQLQLLQSEKMASIGQLASGVAHEINNPIGFVKSNLGSLTGYVETLLEIVRNYEALEHIHGADVAPALAAIEQRKRDIDFAFVTEDVRKLIEESTEGVQRVSQIVRDLKNFSRSGDATMAPADLQAGIESTINVAWNQLKYKVEVRREYQPLPPVRCVASQINQVVLNLLTNAEQAIAEHGTITVRTGLQEGAVWFEVQDSGCGMTTPQQARIFEPFFTTKPMGQGTGLGLSISFGIVQRHGGHITVQSAPGAGSTFRVTLPLNGSGEQEQAA